MADIPVWPGRLPVPSVSGYGYQPTAPYVRTNMDSGLARQRRRFTTFPSTVSVVWRMTQDQLELFEGFLVYEIQDGTSWFTTPLKNGLRINSVKARFEDTTAPYKVALVSDTTEVWDVSATLETLSLPRVTADQYQALQLVGPESDVLELAQEYYEAINVVLPTGDTSNI